MKIVLAPNALKGSLTAVEASLAMAEGVRAVHPEAMVELVPVSDGGDGLVSVLAEVLKGKIRLTKVLGPRGDPVVAESCALEGDRVAVIEMARASGLALLPQDRRDPLRTSTFGTGELIRAALERGAARVVVGIGGSATNDGGIGMAAALGIRFLNEKGHEVEIRGSGLAGIRRIDMSGRHPAVAKAEIEAICDVDNPLLGPTGASHVYGPQKGATPEMVEALEAGLANLADVIERDLGLDVRALRGAGAAGGLGAGLCAFLGARLRPGVDVVLDLVKLDERLNGADLVLTAEGRLDRQTVFGKAPAGVARRCREAGIPCIAIGGSVEVGAEEALREAGIVRLLPLSERPLDLQESMHEARPLIRQAAERAVRLWFDTERSA